MPGKRTRREDAKIAEEEDEERVAIKRKRWRLRIKKMKYKRKRMRVIPEKTVIETKAETEY